MSRREQVALHPAPRLLPAQPASLHTRTHTHTCSVPVERLQRALTPAVAAALGRNGYAVVDGALGADVAAALRAEVAVVRRSAAMQKNHTHLVHGGATGLLEKEHVFEAELMQASTQALAPLCAQLQHDTTLARDCLLSARRVVALLLRAGAQHVPPTSSHLVCLSLFLSPTLLLLQRVMLSVLMPELSLQSQAIKLQWNEGALSCVRGGWERLQGCLRCSSPPACPAHGSAAPTAASRVAGHGGCFPMHFDTDAALDTRRVTTIWYLNPSWAPGDGGELRLYPFPGQPLDIEPLNDRLVLFSSQEMLHRVLPSSAERVCFTVWMSEDGARRPQGGGREEVRRALSSGETLSEYPDISRCPAVCLCL